MVQIKETRGDRIFSIINLLTVSLLTLIVLYPLIYIVSCSISDPSLVGSGQVWLYPKGITFAGYRRVFMDKNIMIGYGNTIFYTVFGTLLNLFLTLTSGYAISRKTLPLRGIILTFFVITMYFSGGLIPSYLLVKNLGLIDSRLVLIISGSLSVYNMIVASTFFQNVPKGLEEAALIDGCTVAQTFIKIILPLSKALIGVMVLYYGVGHWNSYFDALIYISDTSKKPLQIFLRQILVTDQMSMAMSGRVSDEKLAEMEQLKHLLKYAVIIVSSLPVLIMYPFLQKYFDKGVMLGSLKG
ncbi:MAG: carbohydrate ABC transporter permease [Clostridiaceae bacterium]